MNDQVSIPPDGGRPIIFKQYKTAGFQLCRQQHTSNPINYDLTTDVITTNNHGNYFLVLSNLNNRLAETNRSPALLPLRNRHEHVGGGRVGRAGVDAGLFHQHAANHAQPGAAQGHAHQRRAADGELRFRKSRTTINFEGWGLINLPDSLPPGVTNLIRHAPVPASSLIKARPTRWPPATAIPIMVTVSTNGAQDLPLRITLAWTDPPGDPAAAIKLVNSLELVVTNSGRSGKPDRLLRQRHSGSGNTSTPGERHERRRILIPSTTSKTSSSRSRWARIIPSPSWATRERQRRHRANQHYAARTPIMRPTSCRISRW